MDSKVIIDSRRPDVSVVERQWFSGKIQLCHINGK